MNIYIKANSNRNLNTLKSQIKGEVFTNKIKTRCFVCLEECNKDKQEDYYILFGNMCRNCSANITKKLKTPESREFVKRAVSILSHHSHLHNKKESDIIIYEDIKIPAEEE